MKTKETPKVGRSCRILANSTEWNMRNARILAAKEVPFGEKGTVQDWVNYIVAALAKKPELAHKLYWDGKDLFEDQPV